MRGIATLLLALPAEVALGGEVIKDTDTYQGVKAEAPISVDARVQNKGGSDGAGLCVLASICASLRDQGHHEVADEIWRLGLAAPGGYYPEKLDALLRRVASKFPDKHLKWYHCTDARYKEFAAEWTSRGIAVGVTMGEAIRYPGPVAHMTALELAGKVYWLFMDNNFVTQEFDRRGPRSWVDAESAHLRVEMQGGPWVVAVVCGDPDDRPDDDRPCPCPNRPTVRAGSAVAAVAAAFGVGALAIGAIVAVVLIRRNR